LRISARSSRRKASNATSAAVLVSGILDVEIGVLVEEAGDLGLDRLRQQGTRTIAQDFGELIVEGSWLE
jgi:hypothetical protein